MEAFRTQGKAKLRIEGQSLGRTRLLPKITAGKLGKLRQRSTHQEFCFEHIKCELLGNNQMEISEAINMYNLELKREVLVQSKYSIYIGLPN